MSGKNRSNPDAQEEAGQKQRKRMGVPNPHDTLFRALMSDPVHVQALLRDHLPNEIAGKLADTLPKIEDGTFIDEDRRSTQSDLLVTVKTVSGGSAFAYFLVEHKAYPDPGAVLQLIGYMVQIWQRHAQGKAERLRNLPPIIPMVFYTGQGRWTVPESLAEMIASDDPELVFLPGEGFIFRWLTEMAPEALSRNPVVQAGLLTVTQRALEFLEIVSEALAGNPVLQKQIIGYIFQTNAELTFSELQAYLTDAGAHEMEGLLGTIAETLIAEGKAKGRAEGKAEGIAEGEAKGEAKSLTRLLERRFGPLPRSVKDRIASADLDQLDTWIDRVLDARSLDAVFGD